MACTEAEIRTVKGHEDSRTAKHTKDAKALSLGFGIWDLTEEVANDKEDLVLDALQRIAVAPGDYAVPHAGSSAGMRDPAFIAKATKGPLAFMTLAPGAAPIVGSGQ